MSSLFINRDSHIMMLEVAVEKLFVPTTSPFDEVITSKFIVSFRFYDDDWIDIVPKRPDYKEYHGSIGKEQYFHGGKSVVFSMFESDLDEQSQGLVIDVRARREISRYFENEDGHVKNLGCISVDVDELFNSIVEELQIRNELKDYLNIIHKHDPISMSLKGTYSLNVIPNSYLELYIRMSYLGDCIIGEIDKPYRGPIAYFYVQEHTNMAMPYECCELQAPGKPKRDLPFPKPLDSCAVICTCTDDQRYKLLFGENTANVSTQDDQEPCEKKCKKKKRRKSKDDCVAAIPKRARGVVTVGIVDKEKPCEPIPPICIPCCPTNVYTMNCSDPPCLPDLACLETICCD